jgi:hypothetical protein
MPVAARLVCGTSEGPGGSLISLLFLALHLPIYSQAPHEIRSGHSNAKACVSGEDLWRWVRKAPL